MRHWKVYKDRVIGVPTGLLVCVKSPIGKVDTKANDPNLRMVAKVTVPLFPGLSWQCHSVPLASCSRSIASNSAFKLP